jgi:hypothetical protein
MCRCRESREKNVSIAVYVLVAFAAAVMVLPAVGGVANALPTHVTLFSPKAYNVKAAASTSTCNGIVDATSENWGGYAVQSCLTSPANDVVTFVNGTWTEPTVTCPTGRHVASSYAAFWVGIDGYSSSTVEQIGTDSDCNGATPSYYAWYEMYPANSYTINMAIHPGNTITASVTYTSSGAFLLKIVDITTKASYSTTQSMSKRSTAERSSGEWIVEAPSSGSILPLANFGAVTFSSCYVTLSGTTGPIQTSASTWQASDMNIATSTTLEETTSGLNAAGNGFTGTWDAS